MPNWVYNRLTVTSGDADAVERLVAAVPGDERAFSFNSIVPRPADEEDNWYNWNLANWGCKWDTSDISVEAASPVEHLFYFNTPWSPAIHVMTALSKQHPNVTLNLVYEEEQGWGGELEFVNGTGTTKREWDIPSTHAEIVERGGSCYCDNGGDRAWFPDCFYAQAKLVEAEHPGSINARMFEFIKVLGINWEGDVTSLIAAAKAMEHENLPVPAPQV